MSDQEPPAATETPGGARAATGTLRRTPGRIVAAISRYRTEWNTPLRQALAIGLGVYIGASPFFGFHLLLALALGRLFHLNRFKVYLAANISNPLIAPALIAAEIQVGAWLRTGHVYSTSMVDQVRVGGLAADVLLGSVVVGLALAIAASALTYWAVSGPGDAAEESRLIDAAAERYLIAGVSAWEFARSKLRRDPVYLQVLKDGVLPAKGLLMDLGCGQGLMLALLAGARERYSAGHWPAAWPAPPADLQLHGIELRPRVARRARQVLDGVAVIEERDLELSPLPACQAVLIFDVLHLMSRDAQDRLLQDVERALTPGGVLVVREADAGGGWRFSLVRLGNRTNAILQGRFSRQFQFDSAPGWQSRLERLGFRVEKVRPQDRGPFANFRIYARRGAAVTGPAAASGSFGGRSLGRDGWGGPGEPRREADHPLQPDQHKKERDPGAGDERGPPVPREDRHHRSEHPARRLLGKEEIAELGRVERQDKSTERAIPAQLTSGKLCEVSGRQTACLQAVGDCLRGFQSRFERDGHTRRKHRIEKRPGIAREHPAIAGVRPRREREILLDPDRPLAPGPSQQARHRRSLGDRPLEDGVVFERGERLKGGARQHDADAHQVARDRNQPEPPEVGSGDDTNITRAPAWLPRHAGEMREHRDVRQPWFVDA
jgi:uncharacterized protein (DUF2062 family)